VTGSADLERRYRRWLRWYPKSFRHDHEEEMLGVLMAGGRADQCRPELTECMALMASALGVRLRPRVPRSDRYAFAMVRLMYLGAVVELAVIVTILATLGEVKASIVASDPGFTQAQWHSEVTGTFEPLVVVAGLAVGFWLWMAWANGRGLRWARVVFAMFFCGNTYSLLRGLAGGSALYARTDLAAGGVLWLVELAVVALVLRIELRTIATSRSDAKARNQNETLLMIATPSGLSVEEEH
jgi:ABC-type multidrug transport system fused ATPase/permease subunit